MTGRQTLGEVAVTVIADATMFDTDLASTIDRQLSDPMLNAADAAGELSDSADSASDMLLAMHERWERQMEMMRDRGMFVQDDLEYMKVLQEDARVLAEEMDALGMATGNASEGMWDLSAAATGLRSATVQLPQPLGQVLRLLRHPTPAGLLIGGAAAAFALFKMAGKAKEKVDELAASLVQATAGELPSDKFRELVAQVDDLFSEEDRRRLAEWGIATRDLAMDTDLLRETLSRLDAERKREIVDPAKMAAERKQRQLIVSTIEQEIEARQAAADAMFYEQAQAEIAAQRLTTRTAEAVDRVVADWSRLEQEADSLRDSLSASFAGWVDIIAGVPDQVKLSAEDIHQHSVRALAASVELTQNWITATEMGAANVAEAILEAGPAANQAFADLLNNPELLAATEENLAITFDLAGRVAEEQVDRLITPEMVASFKQATFGLGRQGVQGLIDGLRSAFPDANAAIEQGLREVTRAGSVEWGIRSPSTVLHDIGGWGMAGVAAGIKAGQQVVSNQLSNDLKNAAAHAKKQMRAPAQSVGKSIAANVVTGFDLARQVIDRAAADLARSITQRQLEEVRREAERLSRGVTAGETVAVERAARELARLERSVTDVAAAEQEIADAQRMAAEAQQARLAAAERWDFQAFEAAEAQLTEANRIIDARERWLATAREQVATEAELALAAERLREAQEAPAERRVTIVEELRAAELAALRAQLAFAEAPAGAFPTGLNIGAAFDSLLRAVTRTPPPINVTVNFTEVVDEQRARVAARAAADEAVRAFVDGLAGLGA